MTDEKRPGCGAPATLIVYRGPTRRRWLCSDCPNTSSGKAVPYAEAREGVTPPPGTHTGPAKRCGDEVS